MKNLLYVTYVWKIKKLMENGNYKLRYVCRLNYINCKLCKLCKLYSAKNSEKNFIRTYTVSMFVYETQQTLQTVCRLLKMSGYEGSELNKLSGQIRETPGIIQSVTGSTTRRLQACLETQSGRFEHLL